MLVAEDHGDAADLMRTVLQGRAPSCTSWTRSAQALAALASSDIDVLISDIGMPDGTGYDLMARVRDRGRMSGRTAPPAVAVTAFAGADDRERALAAGFQGWAAEADRSRTPRGIGGPGRAGPARSPLSRLHHHSVRSARACLDFTGARAHAGSRR